MKKKNIEDRREANMRKVWRRGGRSEHRNFLYGDGPLNRKAEQRPARHGGHGQQKKENDAELRRRDP